MSGESGEQSSSSTPNHVLSTRTNSNASFPSSRINKCVPVYQNSILPFCRGLVMSLLDVVPDLSKSNSSRKRPQSMGSLDVLERFQLAKQRKRSRDDVMMQQNMISCVCLDTGDDLCLSCPSFKIVLAEDTKLLPDPRKVEEKITLLARISMAEDIKLTGSYIKVFPTSVTEENIPFPSGFFSLPGNGRFWIMPGIRKIITGDLTYVTLVRPKVFLSKYFEAKKGLEVGLGQVVPACINRQLDEVEDLVLDFGVKEVFLRATKETSVFLPGKPKYSTVFIPGLKAASHLLIKLKIGNDFDNLVSKAVRYTLQDNNQMLIPLKNISGVAMEIESNTQIGSATSYLSPDNFKLQIGYLQEIGRDYVEESRKIATKCDCNFKQIPTLDKITKDNQESNISLDDTENENRIQASGSNTKWRIISMDCETISDGEDAQFTQIGCYAYRVTNRRKSTFFSAIYPTKYEEYQRMKQKTDLLKALNLEMEEKFKFVKPDGVRIEAFSEPDGLKTFLTFLDMTSEWEKNVVLLNSASCILPVLFSKINLIVVQKHVAGFCELNTFLNQILRTTNQQADLVHTDEVYTRVMGTSWAETNPTCAQTAKYMCDLVEKVHFEKNKNHLNFITFISKYFRPTNYYIEKFSCLVKKTNTMKDKLMIEIENSFRPGIPALVEMCPVDLVDLTHLPDEVTRKPGKAQPGENKEAERMMIDPITTPSMGQVKLKKIYPSRVLTFGYNKLYFRDKTKIMRIPVKFENLPPDVATVVLVRLSNVSKKFTTMTGIRILDSEGKGTTQKVINGKYGFLNICLTNQMAEKKKISTATFISRTKRVKKKANMRGIGVTVSVCDLPENDHVYLPGGSHIVDCMPTFEEAMWQEAARRSDASVVIREYCPEVEEVKV